MLAAEPRVDLTIDRIALAETVPAGLDLLFAFERLFVGRAAEMACDRVEMPPKFPRPSVASQPGLIVDLTASESVPRSGDHVLCFKCLGLDPLSGVVAALLGGETPILTAELASIEGRRCVAAWAVAIEDRNNTLRGASVVLGRLAHLVLVAVDGYLASSDPDAFELFRIAEHATSQLSSPGSLSAPRLLLRTLGSRISSRLDRLSRSRVDWRVIARIRTPGTAAHAPLSDAAPFSVVPDDGQRFYADPFPICIDGRSMLFVEEFPYATGRGILSVAEVSDKGQIGPFMPILEQDCHLSYPNVFTHEGRVWMIPETSGRQTIELWVADRFPDRWRLHQILVDRVEAADATLAEIDGRWWMFAATRSRWASSWDTLEIWTAPGLMGPWQPVSAAPSIVDVGSARPAGRMFRLKDGWRRPVQDSTQLYGGGLAVCKIDTSDPAGFREVVETRFPVRSPLLGLHTWNQTEFASGYFEVMDVFAAAGKDVQKLKLGDH